MGVRVDLAYQDFSGGELDPLFLGQVNNPEYYRGLKRCSNFIPVLQGALTRRPGTVYSGMSFTDQILSLVPFSSTEESYILAFSITGDVYFFSGDGPVMSRGAPYSIRIEEYDFSSRGIVGATSIISDYAQSNDVIYLVSKYAPPIIIARQGHDDWAAVRYQSQGGPYGLANKTPAAVSVTGTLIESVTGGDVKAQSAIVNGVATIATTGRFSEESINISLRKGTDVTGPYPARAVGVNPGELGAANLLTFDGGLENFDGDALPVLNHYELVAADRKVNSLFIAELDGTLTLVTFGAGGYGSTLPADVVFTQRDSKSRWTLDRASEMRDDPNNATLYTFNNASGTITNSPLLGIEISGQAATVAINFLSNYRVSVGTLAALPAIPYVYREAIVDSSSVRVLDSTNDRYRAFSITPGAGNISGIATPIDGITDAPAISGETDWAFKAWLDGEADEEGRYPTTVTFFENRLCFAGGAAHPSSFWASVSADFGNFTPGTELSDPIDIQLNSVDLSSVVWARGTKNGIIIGTTSSEWLISGSRDSAGIGPGNIEAREITFRGSHPDGNATFTSAAVLHVGRTGRDLREINPEYYGREFDNQDMNVLSKSITGRGIRRTAFSRWPQDIVWSFSLDGELLGTTYERSPRGLVTGWSRHSIAGGEVKDMAIVEHAGAYRLWLLVKRGTRYSMEYMAGFFDSQTDVDDGVFTDASVEVESIETRVTITDASANITVTPLGGAPLGSTGFRAAALFNSSTGQRIGFLFTTGNNYEFTGLDSMGVQDGDEVSFYFATPIEDGHPLRNAIALGLPVGSNNPYFRFWDAPDVDWLVNNAQRSYPVGTGPFKATVGINFSSEAQLPRLGEGSRTGTALGKLRRIHRPGVLLDRTQALEIGLDFDTMQRITFRTGNDVTGAIPLFSGIKTIEFESDYNTDSEIALRVNSPHPCTILSVAPQLKVEDNQ